MILVDLAALLAASAGPATVADASILTPEIIDAGASLDGPQMVAPAVSPDGAPLSHC